MGLLRLITGVILLGLWLPATFQCFLEKAAVIAAADDCCPNSSEGSQDITPCCLLASGDYRTDSDRIVLPVLQTWKATALSVTTLPAIFGEHCTFTATPVLEFSSRWHLLQRRAQLPRAPSASS